MSFNVPNSTPQLIFLVLPCTWAFLSVNRQLLAESCFFYYSLNQRAEGIKWVGRLQKRVIRNSRKNLRDLRRLRDLRIFRILLRQGHMAIFQRMQSIQQLKNDSLILHAAWLICNISLPLRRLLIQQNLLLIRWCLALLFPSLTCSKVRQ